MTHVTTAPDPAPDPAPATEKKAKPPRLGASVIFKSLDGARDWMGQNEFAAIITKVRKSEVTPDAPPTVDLIYFPPHRSHVHLGPVKFVGDVQPTDTMCWAWPK